MADEWTPAINQMLELAWAAGFFDGEGWFSANKAGRSFEIGVGQKCLSTLVRFCRAVGVGALYSERNNTFNTWRATSAPAQLVAIRSLWPYLSEPKRQQARDVMHDVRYIRGSLTRRVAATEAVYAEIEGVIREGELAEYTS